MPDPSRSLAPFLPLEIVSRILYFIYPKLSKSGYWMQDEWKRISRVRNCWREEGQRRLFETININSSKKLEGIAKIAQSGMGRFILALSIYINPSQSSTNDAQLLVQLLRSTCNLKYFTLYHPSLPNLTTADVKFMRSDLKLSSLITLEVFPRPNQQWDRLIINSTVKAAGNLEELSVSKIEGYTGLVWSAGIPSKVRSLKVEGSTNAILEGKIYPPPSFSGLESLAITDPTIYTLTVDFFKVAGSTLVTLRINDEAENIPICLWNSLTALKSLKISPESIEDVSILPKTLNRLKLEYMTDENDFNSLPNLKELIIEYQRFVLDLSVLPSLDSFTITQSFAPELIIESLSTCTLGNFRVEEFILGISNTRGFSLRGSEVTFCNSNSMY